ncbi:alpha-L-fucosidase [Vallitalea guaymasensis]|uniref:alpha-L-fucosidase n=1 Tax=Vallitalea guaymasensis TaxID=1185412 RepID=A0A8J8MEK3_9FIRM|nr:alpha-L-fucosidase [Vallitalea guaymasensis]QUH31517.1 alpha-L-fucosidase [Vallitalea guaymasensis]
MKNIKDYLETIDQVINKGPYEDTWESLREYKEPKWYKDAKFGIFIHWGVYSVPAYGNEWYPRNMYIEGSKEYEHHIKTYGKHKDFGYKDFIPMFKGEKFDADEWMELFADAGAKYVMPVAEHHDGFQMYDSELSGFNAAKMGPEKDIIGALKKAAEERDIVFTASSHRAENYWFMSGLREFDSGLEDIQFQEPYGYAVKLFENDDLHETTHNIHSQGPSTEHLDNWLVRTCELVDKYQPKIVWFDWWIQNVAFKPYLKKFAAYYYNRAAEWGEDVAINYKFDAFAKGTAIFDVERGQLASIRPRLWQTDTAIAKNSWGYTENNDFKTPESVVCDLIDIVSKNGCLLLNIGPKSDGTITQEEENVLRSIGKWLRINGESIYDTEYWSTFGEGPTEVIEGAFNDEKRSPFTSEDIRFTYNAPYIYANVLKWPDNDKVVIKSLQKGSKYFAGDIMDVKILGYDDDLNYKQDQEGLIVTTSKTINTTYPVCIKININ